MAETRNMVSGETTVGISSDLGLHADVLLLMILLSISPGGGTLDPRYCGPHPFTTKGTSPAPHPDSLSPPRVSKTRPSRYSQRLAPHDIRCLLTHLCRFSCFIFSSASLVRPIQLGRAPANFRTRSNTIPNDGPEGRHTTPPPPVSCLF